MVVWGGEVSGFERRLLERDAMVAHLRFKQGLRLKDISEVLQGSDLPQMGIERIRQVLREARRITAFYR